MLTEYVPGFQHPYINVTELHVVVSEFHIYAKYYPLEVIISRALECIKYDKILNELTSL